MRIFVISALLLLTACAGTNWSSRQGSYTVDQAKGEYGPPDQCQNIETGQVCSWTTSIGRNWIDKLILTFDERGVLVSGGEKRL